MTAAAQPARFGRIRRLHLVGIGGSGMSGIAEILLSMGYQVSGSDLSPSEVTRHLEARGARIHQGHDPSHLEDAQVVVVSTAVPDDNPEVVAARQAQIPVIRRSEMLAELMRMKQGVAVAGSHGKTTTTSFIARVLEEAGLDPTTIVGGQLAHLGSGARLGTGEILVCESDESDGSFLKLTPTIAVVTNIDDEHLETYGHSLERLHEAFLTFLDRVPFYGAAVVCLDDPGLQDLLPRMKRPALTYGFSAQADVRGLNPTLSRFETELDVQIRGEGVGRLRLPLPGRHMALNALAAVSVADHLGVDMDTTRRALQGFEGISRRFERKGQVHDVLVVDDYGHHPTEIQAALTAAREGFDRRILAVFQPHRYSRVRDCMQEFQRCFYEADVLLVTGIYPAGEAPIPGATAEALHRGIVEHGHRQALLVSDLDDAVNRLADLVRPGDLVLTLGAGDVHRVGTGLLEALNEKESLGKGEGS